MNWSWHIIISHIYPFLNQDNDSISRSPTQQTSHFLLTSFVSHDNSWLQSCLGKWLLTRHFPNLTKLGKEGGENAKIIEILNSTYGGKVILKLKYLWWPQISMMICRFYKAIYRFSAIYQNSNGFWRNYPKICLELQKTELPEAILRKNRVAGIIHFDFKLYYKAVIIKLQTIQSNMALT